VFGHPLQFHSVVQLKALYDQFVLIVTTESLPGYELRAVLGEVLGVIAISRNPFAAGLRSPDGGAGVEMSQYLVQMRAKAVTQMAHAARTRGANAIVGMRFDHRDITNVWMELCAYGTAVVALPLTDEAVAQDTLVRQTGRMPHHEAHA
jgi:uncharacterized protein YbjQ (UPF0145 family)